jgi:hypothetical protein
MHSEYFGKLQKILHSGCSEYWQNHYLFGKPTVVKCKSLGDEAIRTIVLNTIIPFMFAYGTSRANQNLKDKALNFLEHLKPENNSTVRGFESLGIKADNAFITQAMIQLKSQYCDKRKCLYCSIGASVLLKRIG